MNRTTELGLYALGAALLLGLLGDALRAAPVGINVVLWTGTLLVTAVTLALWRRIELSGEGRWLIAPLLFFTAAFAWRDSATLQLLSGLAAVVTLSLAALRSRSGQLRVQGRIDYCL